MLCDKAKAQCPLFTCDAKLVHHAFKDPVMMMDTDGQMDACHQARDEINVFVKTLPESLEDNDQTCVGRKAGWYGSGV